MDKVKILSLNKKYVKFELQDVSFSIPEGYVTGFIGRNGMGKTTTIKSILSLIRFDGQVIFKSSDPSLSFTNQKIGVIMDDSFLAKDWTMNMINSAMKIGYTEWNESLFKRYLNRFNISEGLKVKELSRGMKIKLMLAVALSHNAELLILDEPTSGLDPSMREEFKEIISEYMQDEHHSVLFSTHITQDLETIADYIVFIDNGKIVLSLEKEEFLNYFMILKCDKDEQHKIPESLILGKKTNNYNVEFLVKRDEIKELPSGYIEDKISIDRIIILYGREENGRYKSI